MKNAFSFFLCLIASQFVFAQHIIVPAGQVIEGQKATSKILNKDVNYSIYLPPDYDLSKRSYPVVYLLHGYTDNETAWVQFGEVNRAADVAIAKGEIPAMIIVMPDAGVSFYINDYQGKTRFEDFFTQEFVPYIDATYRTRPTKEFRGVSGLSMGGYGSLIYAIKHSDMFAACAAFSSAVRTDEEIIATDEQAFNQIYGPLYSGPVKGKARLTDHYRKNSILDLVKNTPADTLKKVKFYIDCGDDDFLSKGNSALHELMRDLQIPHEYRVRDGAHNWTYWRTGITDALKFIGDSFHR